MIGAVPEAADRELDRAAADQDRSATARLLERIADPALTTHDRGEVAATLQVVADPRSAGPLRVIAEDVALPADMRSAALDALMGSGLGPEAGQLREWWDSGDDLLRGQVLLSVGRYGSDLIRPVASDPSHRLHAAAIDGLEYGFEEPGWQDLKIAALGHAHAGVRQTAADILEWDEPVQAEEPLHRAAADPDAAVAVAAVDTLQWYASRSTLAFLHELAGSYHDDRAQAARHAFDWIRGSFLSPLLRADNAAAAGLRAWMQPVWHLLAFTDLELSPEPGSTPLKPAATLPPPAFTEIAAMFAEPDGNWAPKLQALCRYDWDMFPSADRGLAAEFFSGHPDPQVRAGICAGLGSWQDTDRLLALAHDACSWVRKSAIYSLRHVPASAAVAELAWDRVTDATVASVTGCEALATYAIHAGRAASVPRLTALALHDQRESIRAEAVRSLGSDITPVLGLLTEPPLMTWQVHALLLEACAKAAINPPDLGDLRNADNVWVAQEVARAPQL
jgi:HEAT repeats